MKCDETRSHFSIKGEVAFNEKDEKYGYSPEPERCFKILLSKHEQSILQNYLQFCFSVLPHM